MNRIHLRARARSRRLQLSAVPLAALASLAVATGASASTSQVAVIQDGAALNANPAVDVQQFQALGATTLRVLLQWYTVAPQPNARRAPHFNATDPGAYPARNWNQWDAIVKDATAAGMKVDLDIIGGPPAWAQGKGVPSHYLQNHFGWEVNAADYGQFVAAVAKRYDGSYTPRGATSALPKVGLYSIWNEPNMGQQLGPQSIDATRSSSGYSLGPLLYRNLVRSAYGSLRRYSRGAQILVGEFAGSGRSGPVTRAHPYGLPGQTAITSPIPFVQTLYCLDSRYHRLTGEAAKVAGCPTTAGAAKSFVKQNPGLFDATAISTHPYGSHYAPDAPSRSIPKSFVILPVIGRLVTEMDKVTSAWHHAKRFPIWSTEYGFVTSPPQKSGGKPYPSPADAAIDLNESEYLSYKNPRVASYAQYLINDPPNPTEKGEGLFSSGLRFANGTPKPGYNAYRLPLWMPQQTVRRGANAEVWGGARPATFATSASTVEIQEQSGGTWNTLATERVSRGNGYFDTHLKLSTSGPLRLAYTYPASNPFLPVGVAGTTIYSRTLKVTVH
jgi:hypothetical protein